MVKNLPINAGDIRDLGSIPGLGRSPSYLLQYSCLENPHGQRRLAGYRPWGHKESEVTARMDVIQQILCFHKSVCEISSVPEMMKYASKSKTASSEHSR